MALSTADKKASNARFHNGNVQSAAIPPRPMGPSPRGTKRTFAEMPFQTHLRRNEMAERSRQADHCWHRSVGMINKPNAFAGWLVPTSVPINEPEKAPLRLPHFFFHQCIRKSFPLFPRPGRTPSVVFATCGATHRNDRPPKRRTPSSAHAPARSAAEAPGPQAGLGLLPTARAGRAGRPAPRPCADRCAPCESCDRPACRRAARSCPRAESRDRAVGASRPLGAG